MKRLALLILFHCLFVLAPGNVRIARLHYDGGGDWYNDADTIPNLVIYLNSNLKTNLDEEQAIVKPSDSEIFDYPFVFMTGHGNVSFSDKDVANLRSYLLRGGFLYIDDDYGLDKSIRREISRIFPEKQLLELPSDHDLFRCFHYFPNGIPKIHKHDDKRPQAFAIFSEEGRIMLLYTYETNISDGWSNMHNDPQQIRDLALKMGTNLFYYLMTR